VKAEHHPAWWLSISVCDMTREIQNSDSMVYEFHNPRSGFVLIEKWRTNREHGGWWRSHMVVFSENPMVMVALNQLSGI
jgi:hypothetical protein